MRDDWEWPPEGPRPSPGPKARLAEPVPVSVLLRIFREARQEPHPYTIDDGPHIVWDDQGRLVEGSFCWRLRRIITSARRWGFLRPVVIAAHPSRATMLGRSVMVNEGRYRIAAAVALGVETLPAVALTERGHVPPSRAPLLAPYLADG